MHFEPSRADGLQRLHDFLPRAGRRYAESRNHDLGPDRDNVSQLSPWLHAGLLSESEVLEATLGDHDASSADKFVSEVFWRVYFKGYLEQRPSIWQSYKAGRDKALAALDSNTGLKTAFDKAVDGRTGIEAFDHWARELADTGYLHNHARMWFASIWIFTLKLDWHLGADFFLRHLIDGDAASNTLSWRWVGGLHTKGKHYMARKGNIARYTAEHPDGPLAADGLAGDAEPLGEQDEHPRRALDLPGPLEPLSDTASVALLLHDEAASHEVLDLPATPALVIGASRPEARSPLPCADLPRDFAQAAVANGVQAAADAHGCTAATWDSEGDLGRLLDAHGIETLLCPYLPTGWTRDALMPELSQLGPGRRLAIHLPELQRATWPHAKAGFFGVKKVMGEAMREAGIAGA